MPVRLNITLSKQSGLPGFSSSDASCGIVLDLPAEVLDDLERLQRHARRAFAACRCVLDGETTHQPAAMSSGNGRPNYGTSQPPTVMPVGHHGTTIPEAAFDDEGLQDRPRASKKQRDYIRRLARGVKGLGTEWLDVLARKMCGKVVAEFRSYDASRMIETLKAASLDSHSLCYA